MGAYFTENNNFPLVRSPRKKDEFSVTLTGITK